MPDQIAVTGVIATDPRNVVIKDGGLPVTSFRLASQQRRFDREQGRWVDTETNWFTVTAFRALAENAGASLHKGDRIVVRGRLRMREWTTGERSGLNVEIEADAIGHDLSWGRTDYRKVVRSSAASAEPAPEDAPVDDTAEREPVGAVATPF